MEDDVHSIDIVGQTQGIPWDAQGPCKYVNARGFEPYRGRYDIQNATLYLPPLSDGRPESVVEIPVNKVTFTVPYNGPVRFSYECKFPSTPEMLEFVREDPTTPCLFRWWGSYNRLQHDSLRFIDDHTLELLAPLRRSTIFVKHAELPERTLSPWYVSNPDTYTLPAGSVMVRVRFRFHPRCRTTLLDILG